MSKNRQQRRAARAATKKKTYSGLDLLRDSDPLSLTTMKVQTLYDDTIIGTATGFFYFGLLDNKRDYWSVTNWHVLCGRNTDNPLKPLDPNGRVPNRIRLKLVLKPGQPEYRERLPGEVLFQEQTIELYDKDGQAVWYQHPTKNLQDVAVLNASVIVDRIHLVGVNEVAKTNDMAIQIGNSVLILGYPLGFSHFADMPIWKNGSIASEPHMQTEPQGRVVIDATTRPGMSGSPVFMREKIHYLSENDEIKRCVNATRFIGIYASRPNIPVSEALIDEDRRAEIGYFYKSGAIDETIRRGVRGPNLGECP